MSDLGTRAADLWHGARQGWHLAGLKGVFLMWTRFVPRIWLNRRQGEVKLCVELLNLE